jgi:hypothetical protein
MNVARVLAGPRGRMSAVKRRIFNVLAAVSLVLFMATAGMWARHDGVNVDIEGSEWAWAVVHWPGASGSLVFVHYYPNRDDESGPERTIPWWTAAALTSLAPLIFCVRNRRDRKVFCRANHLCVSCGYDLRATPDRCPECGSAVGPGA